MLALSGAIVHLSRIQNDGFALDKLIIISMLENDG